MREFLKKNLSEIIFVLFLIAAIKSEWIQEGLKWIIHWLFPIGDIVVMGLFGWIAITEIIYIIKHGHGRPTHFHYPELW